MLLDQDDVLRVGDMTEFHRGGNPAPQPEWLAERVTQIHIVEEYDDKEGVQVSEVSWRSIRSYQWLVVVLGSGNWARNEDLRPASNVSHKE